MKTPPSEAGRTANRPASFSSWLVLLALMLGTGSLDATTLDTIGLTLLNTLATNANGTGVRVAQVEAYATGTGDFEVNPNAASQPASRFTYYSSSGTASAFPNSVGTESAHADEVADYFYGLAQGVATNAAHVDNYDASYFVTGGSIAGTYVVYLPNANLNDPVVNQSFNLVVATTNEQKAVDTAYDNYAAQYKTLFVTAIGNGGAVNPPATSYNGLGVGAYGGNSSTGPTPDNGRAKPDLVAPEQETSFAAPYVSGAAALLIQAGLRGDGGSDTNSAVNIATLRALLINGALKPLGWTNASPSPLDPRYGSGVLNVFNSYKQLTGGKHGYSVSATLSTGSAHPPTGSSAAVSTLSGWDFNTNTSTTTLDGVNHYYFNVTNGVAGAPFTVTATLAWNRHQNKSAINVLKLFLYNTANSNLVAASVSTVDNLQHVWVPRLPAGRYDLQVWKTGGPTVVTGMEPYALAFEFFTMPLRLAKSTNNVTLSWPVYPAGFALQGAKDLTGASSWNTSLPAPVVNGALNLNQVTVGLTNDGQFFRLSRP